MASSTGNLDGQNPPVPTNTVPPVEPTPVATPTPVVSEIKKIETKVEEVVKEVVAKVEEVVAKVEAVVENTKEIATLVEHPDFPSDSTKAKLQTGITIK